MSYVITWGGGNRRPVSTTSDLEAALHQVAKPTIPTAVGIYPPEYLDTDASPWDTALPPALQFGLGHPDRSFVRWLGPEGGIGVDADAPPWPDGAPDIAFDYDGDAILAGADRARVTPTAARKAAGEFIRTGQRPTCLEWAAE